MGLEIGFGSIVSIVIAIAALFFGTSYFKQRGSAKRDRFLRRMAEQEKEGQRLRAENAEDGKRRAERRAEEATVIPELSDTAKDTVEKLKTKADRKRGK